MGAKVDMGGGGRQSRDADSDKCCHCHCFIWDAGFPGFCDFSATASVLAECTRAVISLVCCHQARRLCSPPPSPCLFPGAPSARCSPVTSHDCHNLSSTNRLAPLSQISIVTDLVGGASLTAALFINPIMFCVWPISAALAVDKRLIGRTVIILWLSKRVTEGAERPVLTCRAHVTARLASLVSLVPRKILFHV